MRGFGYVLIALGVLGLLIGVTMETSVSNSSGSFGRVENIGLLSRQSSIVTVSGLSFVAGCVLIGFASLRDAVESMSATVMAQLPRNTVHSGQSTSEARISEPEPQLSHFAAGDAVKHPGFGDGIVIRASRQNFALVRFSSGHQEVREGDLIAEAVEEQGGLAEGLFPTYAPDEAVVHADLGAGIFVRATGRGRAVVRFSDGEKSVLLDRLSSKLHPQAEPEFSSMVTCPKCYALSSAMATFCKRCGADLPGGRGATA